MIGYSRCIWGCYLPIVPHSWALLHIKVAGPGSRIYTIWLCCFVLDIGTEADTSSHLNSSYFLSREFRIATKKALVSVCWLLEIYRAAIFGHGVWKLWSEEDESMGNGYRCKKMWHSGDNNHGFQWLSTCWLHWACVHLSYTFFSRVLFLQPYHKLPLFYFGLSGLHRTKD